MLPFLGLARAQVARTAIRAASSGAVAPRGPLLSLLGTDVNRPLALPPPRNLPALPPPSTPPTNQDVLVPPPTQTPEQQILSHGAQGSEEEWRLAMLAASVLKHAARMDPVLLAQDPVGHEAWTYGHRVLRDTSTAPGQWLRKVLPDAAIANMMSGEWATQVGGSVASRANTEGQSASEMVETLGLDYESRGETPYLDASGAPVDEVFYVDFPLTPEMADRLGIPVDTALVEATAARSQSDPHAAELASSLTSRDVSRTGSGDKDTLDPYTGTGSTATSSRLPDAPVTVNQELVLSQLTALPEGSPIYRQSGSDQALYAVVRGSKVVPL